MTTRSKSALNKSSLSKLDLENMTSDEKVMYEYTINFDESIAAWNRNKKSMGNGYYKYICVHKKTDDSICGKVCYKELEFCWSHRKSGAK
jgi:hypothetical protein